MDHNQLDKDTIDLGSSMIHLSTAWDVNLGGLGCVIGRGLESELHISEEK